MLIVTKQLTAGFQIDTPNAVKRMFVFFSSVLCLNKFCCSIETIYAQF